LRKPYVLFVGQQMQIKGPHVLVEALARVRRSKPELSLVLVGKSGNATTLIQSAIQRFGLADAVRLVPWVSDEDLRCLYSGAAVMAFPSRYEGFGIPVLEAMRCGTPVITSRYSCLPEIAGDAAHYLEDLDPATIADALTSVLNDSALRRGLVDRGLVNASRFTWQRSAQQVLEALTLAAHRD
jgi:glycosyltransferase involved in cell wall biosynthesis